MSDLNFKLSNKNAVEAVANKPMDLNFKPFHDNVLLEVLQTPDTTEGGIIVPDSAKQKSSRAKVISAGPGRITPDGKMVFTQVKPGQIVVYSPYAGTEISLGSKKYLMIKESELLGQVV